MTLAVVLIVAYLLGSIPTSYIVVYRYTGRDIRTMGTGNPGAMNVLDTVGVVPALISGSGDILKAIAAVGIAYFAGLDDIGAVAAALAVVIGHDYSVLLRLNGGNGMAAAVGGFAALLPLATLIATLVAVLLCLVLHSRRIGGLVGLLLLPGIAYTLGAPETKLIGVLVLLAFTAVKIVRSEGFSHAHVRSDR